MVNNATTPLTTLTAEQKKRLEDLQADIDRIESNAENLKAMGFGVDQIMEKVEWAKNVRKMLLEKFTAK